MEPETKLETKSTAEPVKNKEYTIISKHSQKVISVLEASPNALTPLVINTNKNEPHQRFRFEKTADGFYIIRAVHSQQVLDIEWGTMCKSDKIFQFPAHYGKNQQFEIQFVPMGYIVIKSRQTGQVLDVSGSGTAENTQIIQYPYQGGDNQLWRLQECSTLPPVGRPVHIFSKQTSKALTVSDASQESIAEVCISKQIEGAKHQQFVLQRMNDDDTYVIEAVHSGQVFDIEGGSKDPCKGLIQFPVHWGANQRFYIAQVSNGYFTISAKHSGLCLDVSGAGTADNTKVIQYPLHGGDNQLWFFQIVEGYNEKVQELEKIFVNRELFIVSKKSQKVLDVYEASYEEMIPLIIFPLHEGKNQRFIIEPLSSGYTYLIRAVHSKHVLDIEGGGRKANTRVIQFHAHNGPNQQFQLVGVGEGWFKIRCKVSDLFLRPKGGSAEDENLVVQAEDDGDNSLWRLVPKEQDE